MMNKEYLPKTAKMEIKNLFIVSTRMIENVINNGTIIIRAKATKVFRYFRLAS